MKPNALFKNRYITFNDKKMGSPLPDQLKRDTDSLIFDGKVVLVAQWGRDGEFSLSFYILKLTNNYKTAYKVLARSWGT